MSIRQTMLTDAIKQLAPGTAITIENILALNVLPPDYDLDRSDLQDLDGAVLEEVVVVPKPKDESWREAVGLPPAEPKVDRWAGVQDRNGMQQIVDQCANNLHALRAKSEALSRKMSLARESLARAHLDFQKGMVPADLYREHAAASAEDRRRMNGTVGDQIRRRNAERFVQKRMVGNGRHKGGLPLNVLQSRQSLAGGGPDAIWPTGSPRAAPKEKFGA